MKKQLKTLSILILLSSFVLTSEGQRGDNNELYLHADHPASFGVAYGKNIGRLYSGVNVYVNPFTHRSLPEFIGNTEVGFLVKKRDEDEKIVWQIIPFVTSGFYTCGGEAKREGEGQQGFSYGGGISGYYKHFKAQVSITTQSTIVSFGYFWWW